MGGYIIIDLEMCKTYRNEINGKARYNRELIQIGAVALDESLEVVDSFVTYVSPEFGAVDAFINRLTGISREDTAKAPDAREALAAFAAWLPEGAQIVAWSDNDERQIGKELKRKGFDVPELSRTFGTWIDCQQMFGERMGRKKDYNLTEALLIANIAYDDGAHNALVDARNTARLFKKLMLEEDFEVSPYFISASDAAGYCFDPFASVRRVCCEYC